MSLEQQRILKSWQKLDSIAHIGRCFTKNGVKNYWMRKSSLRPQTRLLRLCLSQEVLRLTCRMLAAKSKSNGKEKITGEDSGQLECKSARRAPFNHDFQSLCSAGNLPYILRRYKGRNLKRVNFLQGKHRRYCPYVPQVG